MKLPHRRQFLHLAAGAAALPALQQYHEVRVAELLVYAALADHPRVAIRYVGRLNGGDHITARWRLN